MPQTERDALTNYLRDIRARQGRLTKWDPPPPTPVIGVPSNRGIQRIGLGLLGAVMLIVGATALIEIAGSLDVFQWRALPQAAISLCLTVAGAVLVWRAVQPPTNSKNA